MVEHSQIEYTMLEEVPLDSELRGILLRLFISTEMLSDQNPQERSSKVLRVEKTEIMRVEAGLT